MRIGIDARLYSSSFTGIGRYVYELIHHVLQMDEKNHYTLFFNDPEFENFQPPREGIEKVLVNAKHYSLKEQWHFNNFLKRANLDLMHFTHFNAPILYRRPCLVTIHDLTLHHYPGSKITSFWHRAAYRSTIKSIVGRAKAVIAVSENTKNDLVGLLKVDPEKIYVIHEGVNPQFHVLADKKIVDDFRAKNDLEKPFILYTGVWRSHKNLVNLIKAFAILKHTHHFDGWLVITGKEDPWYPEVKQAVKDNQLEGEVRFTGLIPDEDLVLLYNAASIYVLPSLYEGFGLPVLESFACGLPVCCANTSSLPEIAGDAAEFFNPGDPNDIASKVAMVYNDPARQTEMKQKGFERLKDFSWEKMATQTLALYNRVSAT